MIPFFRKIRKKMADDNKPLKYMRYAIGEIVLVVIGILIALSINNWNETRKLQNEELRLLFDIKTNLEGTLNNFKNDTIKNQEDLTEYQKIETYFKNDRSYNKELDASFGRLTFWSSPYIINTAYSSLQTKGLDIISNEVLKNAIVNMHEVELPIIIRDYEESEIELMANIVTPFFSRHIRRLHEQSLMLSRPNDFESLKRDEEFKNILSMIIRQRKRGFEFYRDIMKSMKDLIQDIDTELQKRQ